MNNSRLANDKDVNKKLENLLHNSLYPVQPRSEFVGKLRKRLASSDVGGDENYRGFSILELAIGFVGLVSGLLLVFFGLRSLILGLNSRGIFKVSH